MPLTLTWATAHQTYDEAGQLASFRLTAEATRHGQTHRIALYPPIDPFVFVAAAITGFLGWDAMEAQVLRVLDYRLPKSPPGEGRRHRGGPRRCGRRAALRLAQRQAAFDQLAKDPRYAAAHNRPGSMSGRK